MKKFEIGHTYFDRYACDYETLSVIKIVKRTAKTVVFERNGETRRALLREDSNGEYIIPDHYSMACVYRADSEIVDGVPNDELDVYETDEAEEAPESLENAPVEAEKPEARLFTSRLRPANSPRLRATPWQTLLSAIPSSR